MKKNISAIVGLGAILGAIFAGYLFLDARFAKCGEVKAIERRLDYKIENDRLLGMQQRQWQLEAKYPDTTKAPQETQQQLKELGVGLEMQKERVKKLEGF